jgi:hypothetical protein
LFLAEPNHLVLRIVGDGGALDCASRQGCHCKRRGENLGHHFHAFFEIRSGNKRFTIRNSLILLRSLAEYPPHRIFASRHNAANGNDQRPLPKPSHLRRVLQRRKEKPEEIAVIL